MMHVFSLKFFIVMSGWFDPIFQSVLIVKSLRIATSVRSVTGCAVYVYTIFLCGAG